MTIMGDKSTSNGAFPGVIKRPHSPTDEKKSSPNKKVRLRFSPKEFRKQLKTEQKTQALQGFLQSITQDKNQECILAYLEHGGSALEILKSMEGESGAAPVLVFELVNYILLQIGTKLPEYRKSAGEACRYLMNTYLTQINKMLGLSSSMKERVVTLKLLTTIVTFSAVLAKEILSHVNFNRQNLELLIKINEGENEARSAFIHFLIAFLVDGHYPTLSVLLGKENFLTSVINGLKFDKADVVILLLTAMKNHILENVSVSKSVKMNIFCTPVVKDIVNLYNWKGPAGISQKKNQTIVPVDEIDKTKVNEAVHSFLLVLCTSHKFGVVFKDPLAGLGKRQNSLMFTVLKSLERPWEHSYAGELVLKICHACPGLVKTMWSHLRTFLEPRWTEKWLKAMTFAEKLLTEMQPQCIEFAVDNLNASQISQIIIILTAPLSIIKTLSPGTFDNVATKFRVMSLFLKMLMSLENFLKVGKSWSIDYNSVKTSLKNHVEKNFPSVQLILSDWAQTGDLSDFEYLDTAFDLLEKYKILAPQILDSDADFNLEDFLKRDEPHLKKRQIKAVDFFIDLEPSLFKAKTQLFKNAISLSLEYYHSSKDFKTFQVLTSLLKSTDIFEDCDSEVDFWIDGVLNLKNYDSQVALFLSNLIEKVTDNAEYNRILLQSKNNNFSALLLALNDYSHENVSKSVKNYLNFVILNIFHIQTDVNNFGQVVSKLECLPESLRNYISSWNNSEVTVLPKIKGKVDFQFFSLNFLENGLENFDFNFYSNLKLNLLQMVVFYLTNLIKLKGLKPNHEKNSARFLQLLISERVFDDERYVKTVLGHPVLIQNFTLFDSNDYCTKFVLEVVKNFKNGFIEKYLGDFRQKAMSLILKVFRKPEKYQNSVVWIEALEIVSLNYEQCSKLLIKFLHSIDNRSFYLIACHCLNRVADLGKKYDLEPLDNNTVENLSQVFALLIESQAPNLNIFSSAFYNYLKVFPHNLQGVDTKLFDALVSMSEFHKDHLLLCQFLLERKFECWANFTKNLDEICSKRSLILSLLDVVVEKYDTDDEILENILLKVQPYIIKALQKPHKAGPHFQNRYQSVGLLIKKFMKPEGFTQIQKFETTELFHVYLLKQIFDKIQKDEKILGNMIITFIHLLVNLLKQKSGLKPVDKIGQVFFDFLKENQNHDLTFLSSNETLRTFCKLCLKYGVDGDSVLIKILTELIPLCMKEENGKLILDMLFSHSQFLDVILGDLQKGDLLNLWKTLCTKWPQLMERNHVPVLLGAYQGTNSEKIILSLLKMYESKPNQTKFFDFKPFLWGRAAASHYSVRNDVQTALWRQPKMADVLNNLHLATIVATITNPSDPNSYDLDYFLPLFSHLLAPESPVTTYKFTKSGALALALTGLRGDETQRLTTCHVLQRFYFHLEAKQSGKDKLLWLRFVEAVCKGISRLENFEINNFVGVFLARTALVMAQPSDAMYVPLTQYLAAKDTLNFSMIPELYTFLHSPHVDSQIHKHFILAVLRDGLKEEKDFKTFMKSMAFKLISELCSSSVCDSQTRVLILEVFEACLKISLGVKVLCDLSFVPQISTLILENGHDGVVLVKLVEILARIVDADSDRHRNFLIYLDLVTLLEHEQDFKCLIDYKGVSIFYKALLVIVKRFPDFLSRDQMDKILKKSGDKLSAYLFQFGCHFVKRNDFLDDSESHFLRMLVYEKLINL